METREKIQWLKRYRYKKFTAETLWRQAREWQETIYEPSCKVLDGMPHKPSVSNVADKEIIKHLELIDEATKATKEANAIRKETAAAIHQLTYLEHIKVLTLKYIEGDSWNQMKVKMNYSRPQIYRLHDEAIKLLNI